VPGKTAYQGNLERINRDPGTRTEEKRPSPTKVNGASKIENGKSKNAAQ